MCLAVPGKVVKVEGNKAAVNFSGILRQVDLTLLPETKEGDFVLVHAGCAIQTVPKNEAIETIKLFTEVFEAETDEQS